MFARAIILTVVFTLVTTKFVRGFIGEAKDLSLIQIGSSDKDLSPLEHKAPEYSDRKQLFTWHYWSSYAFRKNSVFRADDLEALFLTLRY